MKANPDTIPTRYPPLADLIGQHNTSETICYKADRSGCMLAEWQVAASALDSYPPLAFAIRYALGGIVSASSGGGRSPAVLHLYGGSGRCKSTAARIGVLAAGGKELAGICATTASLDSAMKHRGPLLVDEISGMTPDMLARLIHGAAARPWPVLTTGTAPILDRLRRELQPVMRHRLIELHVGEAPTYAEAEAACVATRPSRAATSTIATMLSGALASESAHDHITHLRQHPRLSEADHFATWGIAVAASVTQVIPCAESLTDWAVGVYAKAGLSNVVEAAVRALRADIEKHRDEICYWPNNRKHKATCSVAKPYARDFGNGMLAIPVETVKKILRREGLTICSIRESELIVLTERLKCRLAPERSPMRVFGIEFTDFLHSK